MRNPIESKSCAELRKMIKDFPNEEIRAIAAKELEARGQLPLFTKTTGRMSRMGIGELYKALRGLNSTGYLAIACLREIVSRRLNRPIQCERRDWVSGTTIKYNVFQLNFDLI